MDDRWLAFYKSFGTIAHFERIRIIMFELEYVKKRKRRKVVAIITLASTIALTTLVIVSFLGNYVGTFTVSLNTGNVKLSLSRDKNFDHPTSFLALDDVYPYEANTYSTVQRYKVDEFPTPSEYLGLVEDDEGNSYLTFFNYTFYIKNTGRTTARYDFIVKYLKIVNGADGQNLVNMSRFIIYQNDAYSDEHNYTIYARKSDTPNYYYDDDGNLVETFQEYIAEQTYKKEDLAEMYYDDKGKIVAKIPVTDFKQDDMMRYTIVFYLEGEDPQLEGESPEEAKLELGVEINAYEN